MRKNIKIVISYDGSKFYGWQRQKKAPTVQGTIETCIKNITGEAISLTGCGRTDSKVHAISYVANFATQTRLSAGELKNAINSQLSPEITVKKAAEAHSAFHSRYSAKRKVYRYLVTDAKSPFLRNYACYVRPDIDIAKMQKAAVFFCGEHDFKAFQAAGSPIKDTKRAISKIQIKRETFSMDREIKIISIEIEATGFLYKMARNIVGTLLYAGQDKIDLEKIPSLIKGKNRKLVPPTARPEGLYLKKVFY